MQALDTSPLLRPAALEAAQDELKSLESKLANPHIEDKGEVYRQMRSLDRTLETQSPKPYKAAEIDAAVRLEKELRAKWMVGMPSMEEMRKAPPGAVEKHMDWEASTAPAVLAWKNVALRLHATEGPYTNGSVANIERFRPRESTLNMDNAQISGKQFFLPDTARPGVAFSDEQIAVLETIAPGLRERLALLTNEQRAAVKAVLPASTAGPDDEPL